MNMTPGTSKDAADKLVRGIKRKTRKHYSAEEKIRIVLASLRDKFARARLTNPIRCVSKKLLDYLTLNKVRHKLNPAPSTKISFLCPIIEPFRGAFGVSRFENIAAF
jgi:hypothetical protein